MPERVKKITSSDIYGEGQSDICMYMYLWDVSVFWYSEWGRPDRCYVLTDVLCDDEQQDIICRCEQM